MEKRRLANFSRIGMLWIVIFMAISSSLPSHSFADSPSSARRPAWSPDGTHIAYSTCCDFDIWVMKKDGTDQINLTESSAGSNDLPTWSPEGDKIYFISSRAALREFDLWVMNVDGANPRNLTEAIEGDVAFYEVSPDETRIGFTLLTEGPARKLASVWILDLMNDDLQMISPDDSSVYSLHSWSPDGSKLVFQKAAQDNHEILSTIYLFNVEEMDVENEFVGPHQSPVWSPDGKNIAVLSSNCPLGFDISLLNPNTSEIRKITNGCPTIIIPPVWSPDGETLAFLELTERELNMVITIVDLDGQPLVTTTPGIAGDREPAWSPDGNEIAFTSTRDNAFGDIWVMNSDGTQLRNLTNIQQ